MSKIGSKILGLSICLFMLSFLFALNTFVAQAATTTDYYVATTGNDSNAGTLAAPFKTLTKAKAAVRALLPSSTGPINVFVRAGTYYLDSTLTFDTLDSGTATSPVTYSAYPGETVVLSGGQKLAPTWSTYSGSIQVATIGTNLAFDQLYMNNVQQVLARYPNFDPNTEILNGYATDALSAARVATWSTPTTGLVRGLHDNMWGGNSFKITGVSGGNPTLQWVGDNNRGSGLHSTYRMVENIFEELDAPGEWFYSKTTGKLYFYPPAGTNMSTAVFETADLPELIHIAGTASTKVKYLTFTNFTFTQTQRTLFTKPYEGLLRGDWAVARAGTIFMQDAEDVTVKNSLFSYVGGNGIFMSGYNRNNTVDNNEFSHSGATDVQVVGLMSAVRYPSTWQNQHTDIQDTTPGPLTNDYPSGITITNNLMHHMGRFEKQSAGVNISMSSNVTVGHNTIYHSPRSGININDGTWGGHILEYNDIFDTVLETSDHGPINAWGRDRFWSLSNDSLRKQYATLDVVTPNTIRNNRIWHNQEWGVDLDDGSSNYNVYNNLLLNTGFKFREGFYRSANNNIIVNGHGSFHVGFANEEDQVTKNIFLTDNPYDFIQDDPNYTKRIYNNNTFWNNGNAVQDITSAWTGAGFDVNSIITNPIFTGTNPWTDPAKKDFTVASNSPSLPLGFVNFPMTSFGKAGSPTPPAVNWPGSTGSGPVADTEPLMGAQVSSIYSDSVKSSVGLGDTNGLYFYDVVTSSVAYTKGFRANDVIRSINGTTITTKSSFWNVYNAIAPGTSITAGVWRNQSATTITFSKVGGSELLNDSAGVTYSGTGWQKQVNASAFNSDLQYTTVINDSFQFSFNGTGIDFITETNTDEGNIDIYIDNVFQQTVSAYTATRMYNQTIYSERGLTQGVHTIKGVMKTGGYMLTDAFNVFNEPVTNAIEAENATLYGGAQAQSSANASNGQDVGYMSAVGSGVQFANLAASSTLKIRYSTTSSGTFSLYVNGVKNQTISFTSTGSWTTYADKIVNVTIPAGAVVKLQHDSGDVPINIDYISVPFEAENATIYGGAQAQSSTNASNGQDVGYMSAEGSGVQFANLAASSTLTIRYSTTSNGTFSLYVNGVKNQAISFTSTGSWTTYADKIITVTIPAGAVVKLQHDTGDVAINIDYITK